MGVKMKQMWGRSGKPDNTAEAFFLEEGQVIYVAGRGESYVLLKPAFIRAELEAYDPDSDPCNKSGIGNG